MANPYTTIEPERGGRSRLLDAGSLALKLMDMRQSFDLGTKRLAETRRGHDIAESQLDIAKDKLAVSRESNRIKATEIPIHKRDFKPNKVLQQTALFVNRFSDDIKPQIKKTIQPIFQKMKEFATLGQASNFEAAQYFVKAWPTIRNEVTENLEKVLSEKTNDEIWMNSEEGQAISELYNLVATDQEGGAMTQLLFGPTLQSFDQELRLTEATIADKERGPEPRAVTQYVGPGGYPDDIITLRNNEMPPAGYVKYRPGINVETMTTPEGQTTTRISTGTGGQATGDLTPTMKTEYQKGIKESTDALVRVGNAIRTYRPEFNTLGYRAGTKWEEIKQIWGKKPDPEANKALLDFKDWYKKASQDYAIAIQSLGKGNLTKNEEKLYGRGLPDPGGELIPKEAPGVYLKSIEERYEGLAATIARYNYYLNPEGMGLNQKQYQTLVASGQVPSVTDMREIIDAKGEELEEYYKSQGLGPGEILGKVRTDLASLFGIGF